MSSSMPLSIINVETCHMHNNDVCYKIMAKGMQHLGLLQAPEQLYWFDTEKHEVNSHANYLFTGDDPKDPWEIYGSDHNSGYAFFGTTINIDKFIPKLESEINSIIIQKNLNDFNEDFIVFSKWNFNDNNSLIILHINDNLIERNPDLMKNSDIISANFGAATDDRLLQEILSYQAFMWLKKIKLENDKEIFEILEDESADLVEFIQYNGKAINKNQKALFLSLCQHIFMSLIQWQDEGEEKMEIEVNISQKLKTHFML